MLFYNNNNNNNCIAKVQPEKNRKIIHRTEIKYYIPFKAMTRDFRAQYHHHLRSGNASIRPNSLT